MKIIQAIIYHPYTIEGKVYDTYRAVIYDDVTGKIIISKMRYDLASKILNDYCCPIGVGDVYYDENGKIVKVDFD